MSILKLLTTVGGSPTATPYSDDVFSAYTYTGNGSTQTINNGIDLAGKGGLVWIKERTNIVGGVGHRLFDTTRGATNWLQTETTAVQSTIAASLTAFTSSGFSLGANSNVNYSSSANYASWSFRNADRFFSHSSVVKSSGSNATVSFPGLETLGMVAVKRTDSTGSWYVWHRSLTAGKLLYLEQTAAEATLGHITVSGTTVTLEDGVIADGSYVVYGYAHDTASDGIIQCGSFTTDGSYNMTAPVVLGWEPQYILMKPAGITGSWYVVDASRGFSHTSTLALLPNTSGAESAMAAGSIIPNATGFNGVAGGLFLSTTAVYIAIRRPNKPPTSGTQVYNAIARAGTGAAATVTGVGFAPDIHMVHSRSGTTGGRWVDRLRGATQEIVTETTAAEAAVAQSVISFNMDGASIGTDGDWNTNTATYINHFFKRAPGVFDEVCDTGTGSAHTVSHNLTVAPEMMIRKGRSGATQWEVWHSAIANTEKLVLDSTAAKATDTTAWNSTSPTTSVFTVGTGANVNTNTATYVTYLFATLSGISKCGTYTGNGTTQNIEMGFTTGARFFLVKATSTTGNWVVFDSVRGIIAGSDPYLLLNSTSAEDTDEDAVDPYSGGITVNETSASNINTNSVVYCYLAIA